MNISAMSKFDTTAVALIGALLVFLIYSDSFKPNFTSETSLAAKERCDALLDTNLVTAKGNVTYRTVMDQLYSPMGYQLSTFDEEKCTKAANHRTFLPLERKCRQTCENVFNDWLTIADQWKSDGHAPQVIPEEMKASFTMNGFVRIGDYYRDEVQLNSKQPTWTALMVEEIIKKFAANQFDEPTSYLWDASSVVYALAHFKQTGKRGIVIGSQTPWVEAACLLHGAGKLVTAEYAQLTVKHPNISYVHPIQLAKEWNKYTNFDFAVSFSSIEHSGLGRYGDPMDPIGDIRELEKVRCLLKPGGLFFLGWPNGPDLVAFNVHRIYGALRWPVMAAGWTVLGAFHSGDPAFHETITVTEYNRKSGHNSDLQQFVYVLRNDAQEHLPAC